MKNKPFTTSPVLFAETIPHAQVAERAYIIWTASGQPAGRDYDHWIEAEQQLRAMRAHEESAQLAARASRDLAPFGTDIDRALEAMAPTLQSRSATSL